MTYCCRPLAALLGLLAMAVPAFSQFTVPEGVETVTDPVFGELPREIIWSPDNSPMVLIPRGDYRIGIDNPADKGFARNEGPAVTVTLDPYYIDKHEVSYETYMAVADRVGLNKPRSALNAALLAEGHPIIAVSHDSATEFARVMKKALPTEAEWEVAARGPDAQIYPWGNDAAGGTPVVGLGSYGMTKKVDDPSLDVSPFGVVGMAGNVGEWCADTYMREYYTRVAGQTNPLMEEGGEARSVRGGDYYASSDGRATIRNACVSTHTRDEVGFRTVFRLRPAPVATPTPTPLPPRATPTPRPEEVFSNLSTQLLPLFQDPSQPLPPTLVSPETALAPVPFLNLSPHDLRIGFFNAETGRLMRPFPVTMEAGTYKLLSVPKDIAVLVLALAPDASGAGLANLGPVSSKSTPLTIIPAHSFSPVVDPEGQRLEPGSVETIQHYGQTYQPLWHEFLVHNSLEMPAEVTISREKQPALTRLLEPGESLIVNNVRPGNLELTARYVGATEEKTSNVLSFRNDNKADSRIFRLVPGASDGPTVRVVTKKLPLILIRGTDIRITGDRRGTFVVGEGRK